MQCKYSSNRDIEQRLNATICRYKDKAVYVQTSDESSCIHLYTAGGSKKLVTINSDDPDFDISSPPLGYINISSRNGKLTVFFVRRAPLRTYKQGLSRESYIVTDFKGVNSGRGRSGDFFNTSEFFDMIDGVYPRFEDAWKLSHPVAISRDICLTTNELDIKFVYYRTSLVGWIKRGTKVVVVQSSAKAQIVSELLQDFNWVIE